MLSNGFGKFLAGEICDTKPGYAKVLLVADGIPTDWLQVIYPFTIGNKACWTLPINTQVAVLMDDRCEDGVILGCTYNDEDKIPDAADLNTVAYEIADKPSAGISLKKGDVSIIDTIEALLNSVQKIILMYGQPDDYVNFTLAQLNFKKLFK